MKFEDLKLKHIDYIVRFNASEKKWSAKNRPNHIVGFQMSGRALHSFQNQKFTIEENCLYFLNQKDVFDVELFESVCSYSIHFTTYEPIETDSFCIKVNNTAEIEKLLDKIEKQLNLSTVNHNLVSSYFYRLCADFDHIRKKNYSSTDTRMLAVREYMDLHFTENDCLLNAYQLCDCSMRRFHQLFKSSYHTTPSKYITTKKIELAKKLLSTGSLSVSEVSSACNFSDVYYFCKVFKANTGYTALEFKKRIHG